MNLKTLEKELIETLNDNRDEILADKYPEDRVHEYVDGAIPAYTADLLELAKNDLWLATKAADESFMHEYTASAAIIGNLYESLESTASGWLHDEQEAAAEPSQ